MAVWASALTKEDLRKVSNSDVQLTHPNKTSWNAVYIYNFALKYLFEHIEDENRAEDCFRASLKEAETFEAEQLTGGNKDEQDIKKWLEQAEEMHKNF